MAVWVDIVGSEKWDLSRPQRPEPIKPWQKATVSLTQIKSESLMYIQIQLCCTALHCNPFVSSVWRFLACRRYKRQRRQSCQAAGSALGNHCFKPVAYTARLGLPDRAIRTNSHKTASSVLAEFARRFPDFAACCALRKITARHPQNVDVNCIAVILAALSVRYLPTISHSLHGADSPGCRRSLGSSATCAPVISRCVRVSLPSYDLHVNKLAAV